MAITLKEIAEIAGVSRGTLDKVIHNRPSVSDETRTRVKEILDQVGYVPCKAGKLLANQKKNLSVGIISVVSHEDDYFYTVRKGMNLAYQEYKEFSFTLKHVIIEKNTEDILLQALTDLAKDNVSAIVFPPFASTKISSYAQELQENGIVLVTYSTDLSCGNRLFFVGNDYYQSGIVAASLMRKLLNNTGRILVFAGDQGVQCHEDRLAGFIDHISSSSTDIEIIQRLDGLVTELETFFATRKFIEEHKEIDGIFIVSRGLSGIVAGLKESHLSKRPKIVTFDIYPDTLKHLMDEDVDFVVDQIPLEQGKMIIDTLFQYLYLGQPLTDDRICTPCHIIIKESLSQ